MRLRADGLFLVGVEDDEVGVRADSDCAFPRIQAEKLCRRGRDDFDKAICAKTFSVNSAGVDEAEAVLDTGPAVGNFREIILAQFLLLLKAEGAMIGGNDLQR